jgi:hypothetical protein
MSKITYLMDHIPVGGGEEVDVIPLTDFVVP